MILPLIFIILFAFMFLGLEIFAAMSFAGIIYLLVSGNAPLNLIASEMVQGISSYTLLAIPFFMLVGELMNASGMTKKVVNLTKYFIGSFKGGLAYAAIFVNMLLACISGSAPADCSAVSSVLIPEMRKEKYPDDFSAAVNSAAAILGPIIPPSIPLVILSILVNISTGRLFIGGILPGILLTVTLIFVVMLKVRKMDITITNTKKNTFKMFWPLFKDSFLALVAPIIILVGVLTGFVTITEVAMLASAYVFVIGVFFYRTISFKTLVEVFKKTILIASTIMFLFGISGIFRWFIAVEGFSKSLFNIIISMNLSPVLFLLSVNLFLLFIGMIMDAIPAMTIFIPMLLPIAVGLGIDPIHFGIIVVVNLMIGLLTPPVGGLLYLESKISGVPFGRLSKAIIPFILAFIACLLIITYVPAISTALPNLIMGGD